MSDSPQTPETPRQRLSKEYEDPHFHDEDEAAPVEDDRQPPVRGTRPPPRRKPAYRPPRRFYEE